ncbi:MAG TPA: hypothetical protein VGN88_03375 [Phycisphaerae bacterium]
MERGPTLLGPVRVFDVFQFLAELIIAHARGEKSRLRAGTDFFEPLERQAVTAGKQTGEQFGSDGEGIFSGSESPLAKSRSASGDNGIESVIVPSLSAVRLEGASQD